MAPRLRRRSTSMGPWATDPPLLLAPWRLRPARTRSRAGGSGSSANGCAGALGLPGRRTSATWRRSASGPVARAARVPATSTGSSSAGTWRTCRPAATPVPASPARLPRSGRTSAGAAGAVSSPTTRPGASEPLHQGGGSLQCSPLPSSRCCSRVGEEGRALARGGCGTNVPGRGARAVGGATPVPDGQRHTRCATTQSWSSSMRPACESRSSAASTAGASTFGRAR